MPRPAPLLPALELRVERAGRRDRVETEPLFGLAFSGPGQPGWPAGPLIEVPLSGIAPLVELWQAPGPWQDLEVDGLRLRHNGQLLCGHLWRPETAERDAVDCAREAYQALYRHSAALGYPEIWRTWNFIGAINEGEGDEERYRRFCVGRQAARPEAAPPAATAIGFPNGPLGLQLFWLAAREPGQALENPRQTAAWRYPRRYGPVAPGFVRAMRVPTQPRPLLLVSGTAAVVGHRSRHPGNTLAQLREIHRNLEALLAVAGTRLGDEASIRAYVRDPAELGRVADWLAGSLPGGVRACVLHAEICRRELSVELELVQPL